MLEDGQEIELFQINEARHPPDNLQNSLAGGPMPYRSNADLPPSVGTHLPSHAQDIFREAFNHAWDSHAGDPRQEEIAHRIAWSAVKRSYRKQGERWLPKDEV